MKRQAKYHGEIGANGKAYTKGQFIAEQAENHTARSSSKKGSGKQEIAPYVWEVPPDPSLKSIYAYLVGRFVDKNMENFNYQFCDFCEVDPEQIKEMIQHYKAGNPWFY